MMALISVKIVPFLLVYLGGNFYFAVIFAQIDSLGESFITSDDDYPTLFPPMKAVIAIWNLGLGSMEYKFKTHFGAFVYFLATLFQVIVSLNLLISVVGDYYDHFQMQKPKIDMKLKAQMMYEIAIIYTTFLWFLPEDESMRIHLWVIRFVDQQEDNEWIGKMNETKKEVLNAKKDINAKIEAANANTEAKIEAANAKIEANFEALSAKIETLVQNSN